MAKMNFSKGLQGRLIGSLAGGAASAVYDRYVAPNLPDGISRYGDYVKIGVGAILPALVKGNQLVTSVSDGLMSVGAANVVSGLLPDGSDIQTPEPEKTGVGRPIMINGNGRRVPYRKFATKINGAKSGTSINTSVKRKAYAD